MITKVERRPETTWDIDENGLKCTQLWRVYSNSLGDDPSVLTATDGSNTIPAYLSVHSLDYPNLKCLSKSAQRVNGDGFPFDVSVVFGVPRPRGNTFEIPPEDPDVKWNRNFTVNGVSIVETVNKTADNQPIKNSAGYVYSDGIQREFFDEELVYSFWTRVIDAEGIAAARGKVNVAPWTLSITVNGITYVRTFPTYTLKLGNVSYAISTLEDGSGAFTVQLPLLYRTVVLDVWGEIGWNTPMVDRGRQYKLPSGVIFPGEEEVDLDGNGGKLTDGADQFINVVFSAEKVDFGALLD